MENLGFKLCIHIYVCTHVYRCISMCIYMGVCGSQSWKQQRYVEGGEFIFLRDSPDSVLLRSCMQWWVCPLIHCPTLPLLPFNCLSPLSLHPSRSPRSLSLSHCSLFHPLSACFLLFPVLPLTPASLLTCFPLFSLRSLSREGIFPRDTCFSYALT